VDTKIFVLNFYATPQSLTQAEVKKKAAVERLQQFEEEMMRKWVRK
jgi:hypothetical protein